MLKAKEFKLVKEVFDKHGMLNYHVLEGMADWVRVVDRNGQIIYANRTMKDRKSVV